MKLLSRIKQAILPTACNVLLLLLGTAPNAHAQSPTSPDTLVEMQAQDTQALTIDQLALDTNEARQQRTTRAMSVLLGWSVINMGTGAVGYFTTEGSTRYFHQMNAAWNVVNALIAGLGIFNARREDPAQFDPLQTLEEGRGLEKILLLNIGLNFAYMSSGAFLWERGRRLDDERLRGYGPSLIVQGAFLLGFDSTLFFLQNRASSSYLDNLRLRYNDGPFLSYETRF